MSVSRRASFAAGIAAVRRENRKKRVVAAFQAAGAGAAGGDSSSLQTPSGRTPTRAGGGGGGAGRAGATITVTAGHMSATSNELELDRIDIEGAAAGANANGRSNGGQGGGQGGAKGRGKCHGHAPAAGGPPPAANGDGGKVPPIMTDQKACHAFASVAKAATLTARKPRMQYEVRPFTRESLEKINIRTSNLIRDYGFLPKRSPNLQDGAQLPAKYEPFPIELLGKPVEELDQYVYEKVRRSSKGKTISFHSPKGKRELVCQLHFLWFSRAVA